MAADIATRLRKLYEDFARGDMAAVLEQCDDGIRFHVPGNAAVSGAFSKATFVPEMIATVMQVSGGTFREDVIDIMTGEHHGTVLLDHRFTRDGTEHRYLTIHLWDAHGDKFSGWWEFPQDLHAFEQAWGTKGS